LYAPEASLLPEQKHCGATPEAMLDMLSDPREACRGYREVHFGVAPHGCEP
jgi:hypothetical protein